MPTIETHYAPEAVKCPTCHTRGDMKYNEFMVRYNCGHCGARYEIEQLPTKVKI